MNIRFWLLATLWLLGLSACERAEVIDMYRVSGDWTVDQVQQTFIQNGIIDSVRTYENAGAITLRYEGHETASGIDAISNLGIYSFRNDVPVSCTQELTVAGSPNTARAGTFAWIMGSHDKRITCVELGSIFTTQMVWTIEERGPRKLQLVHVELLQNDSSSTRQLVERLYLKIME